LKEKNYRDGSRQCPCLVHKITSVPAVVWQVAAANDQVEVLAVLLEYGANLNLRNNVGWTALHQVGTAANDQVEVLAVLMEYGANRNFRNNVGWTALHRIGSGFKGSLPRDFSTSG
jgi:hypothetical protein